MIFKKLRLFLFILLLTSCSSNDATTKSQTEQDEDIREAVIRLFLSTGPTFTTCLSIGNDKSDPSDTFMNRFKEQSFPPKKSSECIVTKGQYQLEARDKQTGRSAVIVSAGDIRWITETEVETQGGSYVNASGSGGGKFTMTLQNNHWIVKTVIQQWAS